MRCFSLFLVMSNTSQKSIFSVRFLILTLFKNFGKSSSPGSNTSPCYSPHFFSGTKNHLSGQFDGYLVSVSASKHAKHLEENWGLEIFVAFELFSNLTRIMLRSKIYCIRNGEILPFRRRVQKDECYRCDQKRW